jgi:biofilm PGA synthesis N-glycosyltransferase PgaC
VLEAGPAIAAVGPAPIEAPEWRRFYLPVKLKFAIALAAAGAWAGLSIWLSAPWLEDLARAIGWPAAVFIIAFIAYVPGFMNAFLVSTILLDRRPSRALPSSYPSVTVLVACYNEAATITDTLRSIAEQQYAGTLEVLVLDDGSTDGTALIAQRTVTGLAAAGLAAGGSDIHMRVVSYPENSGKAAVLNRGLAMASHGHIATIDGDSWLHPGAMQKIIERRISDPPGTKAVAGAVLVRNSRETWLTQSQEWDYFHGIAAVKRMQSMYHGTLVAQGAFSLYDREALVEVGGWPDSVGEDIVLSWALLKAGHRIGYAEDAVLFTHVPEKFVPFAQQRRRWSRGLMEAFAAHGALLLKPRMTTLFIWWNVMFLPLDLVYTFAFIPGIVLALFGHYYIVGIMTLAVLPLAMIWNLFIYRVQSRMFARQELNVRRNLGGFLFYMLGYSLVMQPVCVWGYFSEFIGLRKKWGTK